MPDLCQSLYDRQGSTARIRVMRQHDIQAGLARCRSAGWNQLEHDWQLYLDLSPEGCFVAELQDTVVGTVTTGVFDDRRAWIALMLVQSTMQRRGIGTRLFQRALVHLDACQEIALIATAEGQALYEHHGFISTGGCIRAVRPAGRADLQDSIQIPGRAALIVRPLTGGISQSIAAFDRAAVGLDRKRLLAGLYAGSAGSIFDC
jgi:GNAT superfamily N-acetyltransferase